MMARPYAWEKSYPEGLSWDIEPPRQSVTALLDNAVSAHGDAIFIEYRTAALSFRAFAARVSRFAAGLIALGLRPGDRVALYLPNTPYHPIAFFGVLKAGGAVVHLSPLDAEREIAHKLQDSGARILVTTNFAPLLKAARAARDALHVDHVIVGDDAAFGADGAIPLAPMPPQDSGLLAFGAVEAAGAGGAAFPAIDPDALALLQYTGGTTGLPKGAVHTHATLNAAVAIYDQFYAAQIEHMKQDRVICVLPLFHIYALIVLLLYQLKRGSTLMLRLKFEVESVLRDIEVGRATYFPGVPTMWIALNAVPDIETRDLSSLRRVGSGGAPLPPEVAERFQSIAGLRLASGWGMTETAAAGTTNLISGFFKLGSVGMPPCGVAIEIVDVDDPRRVLGPNEAGEMRIKGPNIFKRYWNNEAETARSFVDGWFLTGDICTLDEDGMIWLVDRKKDMIISGGFNVYPRMIEDAIYEHPDVEEVTVIGIASAYRGEAAKAFVKLKAGRAAFTVEDLRAFLATRLGRHELPEALEFRAALPRTPVGKLSKKELIAEERAKSASLPAS